MKIVDFKAPFLDEVIEDIKSQNQKIIFKNIDILRKPLSLVNISFIVDKCNRVQSTLLCEIGASYVQQSQRYVNYKNETIYIPYRIWSNLKDCFFYDEAMDLVHKSFELYKEMTKLKDPDKKGRLKPEDFVYNIPAEDARYILPLATTTDIQVSMSGDKLIDLIEVCINNYVNMHEIFDELSRYIDYDFLMIIRKLCTQNITPHFIPNKYKKYFTELDERNVFVLPIDIGCGCETVAKGALASQNEECPLDIYESWGNDKFEKAKKIVKNVISFGHTGILEHTRSTFAMKCSLTAYHQVIRHRLQNIYREDIYEKITDSSESLEFYVPESIQNSIFYNQVKELFDEYRDFYYRYLDSTIGINYADYLLPFLMNGTVIKFIVSSNARNDNWIFRERLCLTAQSEIRELYYNKLMFLLHDDSDDYINIYKYGIPPCVSTGKCKEGKLCCGKIQEMKDKYGYIFETQLNKNNNE